jgi:hypothetical protein
MTADRYTKLVLTIIALELGWIAIGTLGVPVSAQRNAPVAAQRGEPTPVIIRGVEGSLLPVTLVESSATIRVTPDRPLEIAQPVKIEADRPIPVETSGEPLLIRTISDPPAIRPGVAPDAFKP